MTTVSMMPLDNVPIMSETLLVRGIRRGFSTIKRTSIGKSLIHYDSFVAHKPIIDKEKI